MIAYLSNPVMLREAVVIKYCEHEGFVKCVGIWKILELKVIQYNNCIFFLWTFRYRRIRKIRKMSSQLFVCRGIDGI